MQWIMHAKNQPAVSGYQSGTRSPATMAATVAIHVAAVAMLILIPAKIALVDKDPGILTYPVTEDPLPPDPPADDSKAKPDPDIKTTVPDHTIVDTGKNNQNTVTQDPVDPPNNGTGNGTTIMDPPREPVFVKANIDPRRIRDFQPDYPGAMIRAQIEGYVKLRVVISAEGRVSSADLIEATDTAFWEATRKQALKFWRFRPATRDGTPVASEQVLTVRFRLADL